MPAEVNTDYWLYSDLIQTDCFLRQLTGIVKKSTQKNRSRGYWGWDSKLGRQTVKSETNCLILHRACSVPKKENRISVFFPVDWLK